MQHPSISEECFEWVIFAKRKKVFSCNIMNCIVLYCIVLYCIVLYCIVLYHLTICQRKKKINSDTLTGNVQRFLSHICVLL